MSSTTHSDLRRAVFEAGEDVQVEVNQRALIDKILARYSGESTVFRELLQNADDAQASHVELRFNPVAGAARAGTLPDLSKQLIANITVRNNGMVFREEDWSRLRKIAEGNPDEQMIGQFGVGFYSIFSMCEEPIVMSGDGSMLFFWKGDQLYVRRGPNPRKEELSGGGKPWTTFHLDNREPAPMPDLEPFCRFLANAMAFTTSLRKLSLYYEDTLLCELEKKLADKRPIEISRDLQTRTPQRLMTVQSAEFAPVQIDVRVMACCTMPPKPVTSTSSLGGGGGLQKMLQAFTSSSRTHVSAPASPAVERDPMAIHTATLFLRVINANVAVSLNSAFNKELQRATKKPPPKVTVTQLIYATKEEFDAGQSDTTNEARRIFDGLVSHNLDSQGRVAIGFLTHQTSGYAASVAARFIPTVERESLDFQAPVVADWNRELLATLGVLSRIVYEDDMSAISAQWSRISNSEANAAEKARLFARAAHVARYFTFHTSTPSPVVGVDAEKSFFDAGKNSITLMSTQGPALASKVRYPDSELAAFIKQVPTLPEEIMSQSRPFIDKLRDRGLLRSISFDDIFKELSERPLTIEEMRACLSWWIKLADQRAYDERTKDRLIDVSVLLYGNRVIPLSAVKSFVNTSTLPTDLPLPPDTLPHDLTKAFRTHDLRRVFGWHDLEVIEFLKNLLTPGMSGKGADVETNMLESPHFAEKILFLLSRIWQNIPGRQQAEIVDLLKSKACVPTRHGLKTPSEAYHPDVNLFEDLDVVVFPNKAPVRGNLEKLLLALGLRTHVDLQLVFSRMLGGGTWSHKDLLNYLVSVESSLTADEVDKLTKTAWLPKEGEGKVERGPDASGQPQAPRIPRYKASELYEPTPPLRALHLPLVEWGPGWRAFSPQGKLLARLGLKKHPPVDDLLRIASDVSKPDLAKAALGYFIAQHSVAGYHKTFDPEKHNTAFVPCLNSSGTYYAKPSETFINPSAAIMGFAVVHPDWRAEAPKLKLRTDPAGRDLVRKVVNEPPKNASEAAPVFGYLSTRISSFSAQEVNLLRDAAILPIGKGTFVKPGDSYFGAQSAIDPLFKELFTFVDDYGPAARPFLSAIGVREAPTAAEVAQMLINDPRRFYSLAGNADRYLRALRQIAVNGSMLPAALKKRMRESAFFLGAKRSSATNMDDEDDEVGVVTQHVLTTPGSIVIIDDASEYARFRAQILACPQEDVLESFAAELGAVHLSKIVQRAYTVRDRSPVVSQKAQAVADVVIERAALFLHDHQQRSGKVVRDDVWLKDHLKAADVGRLELVSTLTYQGRAHSASQAVSAGAILEGGQGGQKKLTLLVAKNLEIDYFEVAEALCQFMLAQQRRNDVLVFMTLLGTPLKTLKRRGYNVDRILNARKAEQEAEEERERQRQLQAQLEATQRPSQKQMEDGEKQLAEMFPSVDRASVRKELEKHVDEQGPMSDKVQRAADELMRREPPKLPGAAPPGLSGDSSLSNGPTGFFSKLRKGIGGGSTPKLPLTPSTQAVNAYQSPPPDVPVAPQTSTRLPDPHAQVSPVNDMKANVLRALSASRPDQSGSMASQPEVRQVEESKSTYCDASGARDLEYVADVTGLRFYCAREISDPSAVIEQFGEALRRFCTAVVRPVAQAFGLNARTMHVFYDLEGPLIAFNRNGSIFLNLRYYYAWHDNAVAQGQTKDALISWYMSVAHELAHNLVLPHNAEHEFWFSSIAEHALPRFAEILTEADRAAATARPVAEEGRLVGI